MSREGIFLFRLWLEPESHDAPNPWGNTDSIEEADFTRTFIHDFVMPFLE